MTPEQRKEHWPRVMASALIDSKDKQTDDVLNAVDKVVIAYPYLIDALKDTHDALLEMLGMTHQDWSTLAEFTGNPSWSDLKERIERVLAFAEAK